MSTYSLPPEIPAEGIVVEFQGCTWSEGWEFGAPSVIYSPVCRYQTEDCIYRLVENVCIDLVVFGKARQEWSKSDLKEFQWRGWSPTGFKKRKNANHKTFRIRFFKTTNGKLTFELLP